MLLSGRNKHTPQQMYTITYGDSGEIESWPHSALTEYKEPNPLKRKKQARNLIEYYTDMYNSISILYIYV